MIDTRGKVTIQRRQNVTMGWEAKSNIDAPNDNMFNIPQQFASRTIVGEAGQNGFGQGDQGL